MEVKNITRAGIEIMINRHHNRGGTKIARIG
jgi:hypothetical protein